MGIWDVINKNEADLKDVTKPATNARVCKHTRESCIGTLLSYTNTHGMDSPAFSLVLF